MSIKIAPSFLAADFSNLERDIRAVEDAGVEYIHLDVMAWHLFAVSFGMDLAHTGSTRKTVQAIAPEDSVDAGIRDLEAVIALQVPDDPDRPQMVLTPEVQNLFLDLGRCSIGMPFRYRLAIDEAGFTSLSIG